MNTAKRETYILVNDTMLSVKAIDIDGKRVNLTSTDHLVYQKLNHMHTKLKEKGKPCLPSKHWLSCHLAVSERTVAISLNKLRQAGLVSWKKTKRYGNLRNVYTVSSAANLDVYIADLEQPVPFGRAGQALKERLEAWCDEAIEVESGQGSSVLGSGGTPAVDQSDQKASVTPFKGLAPSLDEDDF